MKQTVALLDFMASTSTSMVEAVGFIDQLHELEKAGKDLGELTDGYLACYFRETPKRIAGMDLIQNYLRFKVSQNSALKSEWNKEYFKKKKLLKERERERNPLSSPSLPPTPPIIPPIIPQERERERKPPITPPQRPQEVETTEFDRFWQAYPRKVSKQTARRAFNALRVDEVLLDRILTDIKRRMGGEWSLKEIEYIPHPTTYLHQRRWEDETTGGRTDGEHRGTAAEEGPKWTLPGEIVL